MLKNGQSFYSLLGLNLLINLWKDDNFSRSKSADKRRHPASACFFLKIHASFTDEFKATLCIMENRFFFFNRSSANCWLCQNKKIKNKTSAPLICLIFEKTCWELCRLDPERCKTCGRCTFRRSNCRRLEGILGSLPNVTPKAVGMIRYRTLTPPLVIEVDDSVHQSHLHLHKVAG